MSIAVGLAFYRQVKIWQFLFGFSLFFVFCLFQDTKKRVQRLRKQFCDFLLFLSDSLHAGYSLENALIRCRRDMVSIWGEKSDICRELEELERALQIRQDIPQFFRDFGKRSGLEEVELLAEMLEITMRSGGNIIRIAQSVLRTLRRKIDLQEDIRAAITSSLYQQKVMNYMPLGILLYIQWTAYSFVEPMYSTEFGGAFMTVFLVIYGGTVILGNYLQRGDGT